MKDVVMMKDVALTAMLIAAVATFPSAALAQPKPAGSLCRAPEPVLFTCAVGAKTVSVCGQEQGGAVYRFGRPGRVEIEAGDLHFAQHAFWGGGETQVYADTPTHRYIVYDRIVRTGFGPDGHHDPRETVGLLVQSGGRIVSSQQCALPKPFDERTAVFDQRLTEKLVPESEYVPH